MDLFMKAFCARAREYGWDGMELFEFSKAAAALPEPDAPPQGRKPIPFVVNKVKKLVGEMRERALAKKNMAERQKSEETAKLKTTTPEHEERLRADVPEPAPIPSGLPPNI